MFGPGIGFGGVLTMGILAVQVVRPVLLLASTWSSARAYFIKGRLAGMEEGILKSSGHRLPL
jgi:hypothetical protein